MSDNFLSRWSKRKLEVREQEKLAEVLTPQPANDAGQLAELPNNSAVTGNTPQEPPKPELPLPTEADLLAVEQGGDIKAFMVNKVSTELRNKAFKALFSRPEFNVMDGLDIYIDDYNKFTPLSQEDIAKMTFSKQLLSRPDLDIPKLDEIQAGVKELAAKVQNPVDAVEAVEEVEAPENANEEDSADSPRVIPDESQAFDSEQLPAEQSFEKTEKKPG